jgi:hypothetical protein
MGVVERIRGRARRGGAVMIAAALLMAAATTSGAPAGVRYSYDVTAEAAARDLRVDAQFAPGPAGCYAVDDGWGDLVTAPQIERGGRWRPLRQRAGCLEVPIARAQLHLRYRFQLAAAAARNERAEAWERQGVMFARPSLWLVRPAKGTAGTFRLNVRTPPGIRFATGLTPVADDTYEGRAELIDRAPYSLFGAVTEWPLDIGGGRIRVALAPGPLAVTRSDLDDWVRRAAEAVAGYAGAFPLPNVLLVVVPSARGRVGYGTTWGFGGASIVISVGASATRSDLQQDWELTHEMVHLTLPNLPRGAHWMEEGLATYVEPIARGRAHQIEEAAVWRELVTHLPIGLPREGDRGLALTHTWARTYWGGALFWFLVDERLRERTEGKVGLPDLLSGLHGESADIRIDWEVVQLLDRAQRLTGTPVVREVYAELAEEPGRPDLESLWERLGVKRSGDAVTFDDEAPLARVRKDMIGTSHR